MCESEVPQFAQGMEYYSQMKQISNAENSQTSGNNNNNKHSFSNHLQKKPTLSFGQPKPQIGGAGEQTIGSFAERADNLNKTLINQMMQSRSVKFENTS